MNGGAGRMKKIRRLLITNRSEIAIRVMRAATEMGIRTIAIYSNEDRLALHRFKADESYLVGAGKRPIQAYLDIADVIRIALETPADAVHPGYGLLSENPEFAAACARIASISSGSAPVAGITGTPAATAAVRAATLLPSVRITSGVGPMNFSPWRAQATAKSGFSERKP